MWHIVRAEWSNNWKLMLAMFGWMHVTMVVSAVFLDGTLNPGILAVAILLPASMGFTSQYANETKEQRLDLWASLPLSRIRLGAAYCLVLLTPWPLAVLSSLGMGFWWPEMPAVLFAGSGLLLALLSATLLIWMLLGRAAGLASLFLQLLCFLSINLMGLLDARHDLGLGLQGTQPSLALWQWLQQPLHGIYLFLLAAALSLAAVLSFRSRTEAG